MPLFDKDYSAELAKEQPVGAITNTYLYVFNYGYRGMGNYRELIPYDLIITEKSVFGNNLSSKNIKILNCYYSNAIIDLNDKNLHSRFRMGTFKKFIDSGKVTESYISNQKGNMDMKFDFTKIKDVKINKPLTMDLLDEEDNFSEKTNAISASLTFNNSSFNVNGLRFIFDRELLDKVVKLLNKTVAANKVIRSE